MELTDLFKIIADYLGFSIDLLLLQGIEKYARTGTINPELVSFFLAGVSVAYLIASMKRLPGYEGRIPTGKAGQSLQPADTEKPDDSVLEKSATSEMARFVLLSIVGGVVFHGFLIVYHKVVGGTEIGTVKDTLNAVFAVNAVYNPLNAFLKQLQRAGNFLTRVSRGAALLGTLLLLIVTLGYFGFLYYWVYALAGVHGTSRTFMLGPMGVMGTLGIALAFAVIRGGTAAPAPAAPAQRVATDEKTTVDT